MVASSLPDKRNNPRTHLLQSVLILVFLLLFSALLYTFLHEGGHAVLGLIFGAKLTSFSVDFIGMTAHVGLDSAFTPVQQSFVSLAGFSFPLLLTIIFLLSAPRRGNPLLEWTKLMAGMISISSLLAWVVLPWLYLAGKQPGDDSITFILHSGIYPPLVSAGAALIFAGSLAVFLNRLEGPRGILARLRAMPAELVTPASRRTLAVLALIFVGVGGIAFALGAAFGTSKAIFLKPPADYIPAVKIQLSDGALVDQAVYRFTLVQPSSVSLFFAMEGLTHGPGKISLTGPNGYENVFYTDGEKTSGNFTVHPVDLALEAGQYQVVVTFPQGPGVLQISQKIK